MALLHGLLEHLEVNVDRIRDNLLATKGVVQAEHVMLALARKLYEGHCVRMPTTGRSAAG